MSTASVFEGLVIINSDREFSRIKIAAMIISSVMNLIKGNYLS